MPKFQGMRRKQLAAVVLLCAITGCTPLKKTSTTYRIAAEPSVSFLQTDLPSSNDLDQDGIPNDEDPDANSQNDQEN